MRDRMVLRRGALAGALVFMAACGGAVDESAETVQPAPTVAPTTVAPTTAPPPSSDASSTTVPSTEQPIGLGEVASGALALLEAGFAAFDEPQPVRITTLTSQTIVLPALGLDSVSEPSAPMIELEALPNGDSHTLMRVGQLFAPLMSADPALAEQMADIEVEFWIVGDTMTIDATEYQLLADLDATVDLGPFAPGLATIRLAELGEVGGADVATLLTGSSAPDPAELGRILPGALTSLVQDAADPSRFEGTATYGAVLSAQGSDPEQVALSTASGIAANFDVDARELAAFYVELFEQLPTQVTFTLDDAGALRTLTTAADMSSLWPAVFAEGSPVAEGATSQQLEDARSQVAGSVWTIRSEATFEIDDTIAISPPVGDFEDRTQIAIDYFEATLGG